MKKVRLNLEKLYNEIWSAYENSPFLRERGAAHLHFGGVIEEYTINGQLFYSAYSNGGRCEGTLLADNLEECEIIPSASSFLTNGARLKTSKGVLRLSGHEYDIAVEEAELTKTATGLSEPLDEIGFTADVLHKGRIDEIAKELKDSAPQIVQDVGEEMVSVKVPKSLLESEGETVYYIMDGEICECDLCSIVIDTKGVWVALLSDDYIFPVRTPDPEFDDGPQDWCEKGTLISADEWGKTLFPTRERAEAYLEEEEEVER